MGTLYIARRGEYLSVASLGFSCDDEIWYVGTPAEGRNACVIARRRRVSVLRRRWVSFRPKVECFARRRRAHCPGAKRP